MSLPAFAACKHISFAPETAQQELAVVQTVDAALAIINNELAAFFTARRARVGSVAQELLAEGFCNPSRLAETLPAAHLIELVRQISASVGDLVEDHLGAVAARAWRCSGIDLAALGPQTYEIALLQEKVLAAREALRLNRIIRKINNEALGLALKQVRAGIPRTILQEIEWGRLLIDGQGCGPEEELSFWQQELSAALLGILRNMEYRAVSCLSRQLTSSLYGWFDREAARRTPPESSLTTGLNYPQASQLRQAARY